MIDNMQTVFLARPVPALPVLKTTMCDPGKNFLVYYLDGRTRWYKAEDNRMQWTPNDWEAKRHYEYEAKREICILHSNKRDYEPYGTANYEIKYDLQPNA